MHKKQIGTQVLPKKGRACRTHARIGGWKGFDVLSRGTKSGYSSNKT